MSNVPIFGQISDQIALFIVVEAKVGIGTLKVSRYRYSVLAPKSNSVPVLGTPFKMYRLTFAVPVLFEKNVQYQSSTIGGKKK